VALPPALAVGGVWAVALVLAAGLQGALAAGRWPEVGGTARTLLLRVLPATLGWIVIVVAVDAGAGWLLDEVRGHHEDEPVAADAAALAGEELPPTTDPRLTVPAYAGESWPERYFEEMDALAYTYVPFIGPRVRTVHGQYINSSEGIRRSYEPAGADDPETPEVWFFGGSTMWGEGQRDLHTIPSEVARLAEADGVPLHVVNFGERGYTAYQEFLLFEQESAARGAPDLAVFFDGQNELGTQHESPENLSVQPTVYQLATVLEALRLAPALPGQSEPAEPSLEAEYEQTSAVHKLLRMLDLIEPVAAQETDPERYQQELDNAVAIYSRSVQLIRDLGRRRGTRVVNFWQPGRSDNTSYQALVDRIPAGVVDITDAFDPGPGDEGIFIDGGHTNEVGARLAAEAIWEHLAPVVDQ
jgi:lysophospholipase L1-like esterase